MESQNYSNPYSSSTFLGFFVQLAIRFWKFASGELKLNALVSDEIQMLVLAGVAASCAIVGTFLVLRKMTMLANSLSHTILIGIVLAFLWTSKRGDGHYEELNIGAMLMGSLVMGLITTFLTELLTKGARLQEDASIGLVFTSLFAVGIISLTILTHNAHIGTEVVMGNVDALQLSDCRLVYLVLAINVLMFGLFFKEFQITTFDAGLSRALGISPTFFNYLLMMLVSITVISAFRAVGVLLVLALITGPVLTARLIVHSLKKMLVLSVLIGVFASILGVALSRHVLTVFNTALSTGGIVVCTILLFFLCAAIYSKRHVNK